MLITDLTKHLELLAEAVTRQIMESGHLENVLTVLGITEKNFASMLGESHFYIKHTKHSTALLFGSKKHSIVLKQLIQLITLLNSIGLVGQGLRKWFVSPIEGYEYYSPVQLIVVGMAEEMIASLLIAFVEYYKKG